MDSSGSSNEHGRRRFLSRIIVAVQSTIGAAITYVVGGAVLAPSLASPGKNWQRAVAVADLVPGAPTPVTLRIVRQDGYRQVIDRRVVYILHDGQNGVRVLDSTCTHLGCLTRYDVTAKQFQCPCHGGAYDEQGAVVAGPPPAPLQRLEARIDGPDVVVQV